MSLIGGLFHALTHPLDTLMNPVGTLHRGMHGRQQPQTGRHQVRRQAGAGRYKDVVEPALSGGAAGACPAAAPPGRRNTRAYNNKQK